MGVVYSNYFVRLRDDQAIAAYQKEIGPVELSQDQFYLFHAQGRHVETPKALHDFGARELSQRYGEAIYLMAYDGPAGELCGTFWYEHAKEGEIVRALALTPDLWQGSENEEMLIWRRAEGLPEAWEAPFIQKHQASGLDDYLTFRLCYDLPQLTETEQAELLANWRYFQTGLEGLRFSEAALYSAVAGAFDLPEDMPV